MSPNASYRTTDTFRSDVRRSPRTDPRSSRTRLDVARERGEAALLPGGQGRDVHLSAAPENREPTTQPRQPQVGADGERQGKERDDSEDDRQRAELRGGQGHPGRVVRAYRPVVGHVTAAVAAQPESAQGDLPVEQPGAGPALVRGER